MRALVVALMVVVLGVAAPAASAANKPPVGLKSMRVVKLTPHSQHKTCTARSRSSSAIARATGKLTTTACEQPPRVKALLTTPANALVIP